MTLSTFTSVAQRLTICLALLFSALAITVAPNLYAEDPPPPEEGPHEILILGIVNEPIAFLLEAPSEVTITDVSDLPSGLQYDSQNISIVGQLAQTGEYFAELAIEEAGQAEIIPIRIQIFTPENFPENPHGPGEPGPDDHPQEIVIHGTEGQPLFFQLPIPPLANFPQLTGFIEGIQFNPSENALEGYIFVSGDHFGRLQFQEDGVEKSLPIRIQISPASGETPGEGEPGPGEQPQEIVIHGTEGLPLFFQLPIPPQATFPQLTGFIEGIQFNPEESALEGYIFVAGDHFGHLQFQEGGLDKSIPIRIQISPASGENPDDGGTDPDGNPVSGHGPIMIPLLVDAPLDFHLPVPFEASDVSLQPLPLGLEFLPLDRKLTGTLAEEMIFQSELSFFENGQEQIIPVTLQAYLPQNFPGDPNNPFPGDGNPFPGPQMVFGFQGQPLHFPLPLDLSAVGVDYGQNADGTPSLPPPGIEIDFSQSAFVGTPEFPGYYHFVLLVSEGEQMRTEEFGFDIQPAGADGSNGLPPINIIGEVGLPLQLPLHLPEGFTNPQWEMMPEGLDWDAASLMVIGQPQHPGLFETGLNGVIDGEDVRLLVFFDIFGDFNPGPGGPGHFEEYKVHGWVGEFLSFPLPFDPSQTQIALGARDDGVPAQLPIGVELDPLNGLLVGFPQQPGFFDSLLLITEGETSRTVPVFFDIQIPFDPNQPIPGPGDPNPSLPPEFEEEDHEIILFGTVGTRFSFKFPSDAPDQFSLPTEFDGDTYGLPTGLTFDSSTQAITGAPTESGIFEVLVVSTEDDGSIDKKEIVFLVSDAGSAPKLPFFGESEFEIGMPFEFPILASGSPTLFAILDQPTEISLNPETGIVSGNIDHEADFGFVVKASNTAGDAYGIHFLEIENPDRGPDDHPDGEPGDEPDDEKVEVTEPLMGRVGVPFQLTAPSEFDGAAFSLVGEAAFPSGLAWDTESDATISGTPTAAGLFRTHIKIAQDEDVEEIILTFFIADSAGAPQFVSKDFLHTKVGAPFELPIILANGPADIEIQGDIAGINYDSASKTLRGTLTEPGFHVITAIASNDNGKAVQLIDIDVWDDGSFQHPDDREIFPFNIFGIIGEPLDFPLPADPARSEIAFVDNPDGTPSLIPAGLEYLEDYALIKGFPSQEGIFNVFIEVTEFGFTRKEHLIFEIYNKDNLPDDHVPTDPGHVEPDDGHVEPILGKVGERLFFQAPVHGENVSFEIVAGKDGEESELPPGVTFNEQDGILSGVPTASGIYPLYIKVDDKGHVSTHFAPVIVSGPVGTPEFTSLEFITVAPGENFDHQFAITNEPTASHVEFFDVPGVLSYNPDSKKLSGKFEYGGFFTLLAVAENDTGKGYGILNIDVLGFNGGVDGNLPLPDIPLHVNGNVNEEIDFELPSFIRGSSFVVGQDPSGWDTVLPDGVLMDPVTGRISGTPIHQGHYFAYVTVDDGDLPSLALNFGIVRGLPTPEIISPEWWVGHQDVDFYYHIHATDFPLEFFAENLPAGLSLDSATGFISGTPTAAGDFEVKLKARNNSGIGSERILKLFIEQKPRLPIVSAPFYKEGQVGETFSLQITATEEPDSFEAMGLPAGLVINPDTGEITGTPIHPGFFDIRLRAHNEWGMGVFHMSILVKRGAQAPVYIGPGHVGGKVGKPFFFHPPVNGAVSEIGVAADSLNQLPEGLSIDTATGQITGTPSDAMADVVHLQFSGPGGSIVVPVFFKIAPALNAPLISSSPLARGTTGQAFSYQIVANNEPVEFSAENMPSGLELNPSTGLLSGAPQSAGYFDLLIRARNIAGWGPPRLLILDIVPGLQAPMIRSAPFMKGQVGQAFSYQIEANNLPTGFAVNGDLPSGLALDSSTGLISGTPAKAGVAEVVLSASNSSGSGNGMVFIIAIRPSLEMPRITSTGTAFGKVNEPFLYQIRATGTPTSYKADNLPDGLVLNESTGFITGTPRTPTDQPQLFVIYAINASGESLPRAVILEVLPSASAPVILSGGHALGKVGDEMVFQVLASNEPTAYISQNLPQGLSIDSASGLISGNPEQAGQFFVELQATNDAGTGEPAVLILFILPGADMPRITSAPYAAGKVGEEFQYQIVASTDEIDSYQVDGDLPRGIDFDPTTGLISGSPIEPTVVAVYLTASNDAGTSMPQPLTLKIEPSLEAPIIVSSLRARGMVGEDFSYEIQASNMPEERPLPPSASLEAVGLPSGLGINAATGIISGTPEEAGLFPLTLVASNETAEGNPKILFLKIDPALDAPEVISTSRVSAQVGKAFNYQIVATNEPASYDADHSIAWLGVNTETGLLTGTPTTPGKYFAGLYAANDSGTSDPAPLEIVVYPAADTPKITSSRAASGKIGEDFEYQITATNTPNDFAVSGLPAGLELDSETGIISGSPTASGTFELVMIASNANGGGEKTILELKISPRFEIKIVTE